MNKIKSQLNLVNRLENPRHGGNLEDAIKHFGGNPLQWLDLSTGISPWNYPIPKINDELWRQLPNPTDKLEQCAASYYRCDPQKISTSPGTQLAIRLLPNLLQKQTVAMPLLGYQEHHFAWAKSGHKIKMYHNAKELNQLINDGIVDSAVVINPNNPTNELIKSTVLEALAKKLNGVLIVDEAFADFDGSESLASLANNNIIVMRSIGKFFGLAGARIGFLIGEHPIVETLKSLFTPWSINSPADTIVQTALNDPQWKQQQLKRIAHQSIELKVLLNKFSKRHELYFECRANGLFTSLFGTHSSIESLHVFFAKHQLWTRIGDPYSLDEKSGKQQNWLRLSLPGIHFNRLETVLNRFTNTDTPESTSS